METTSENIRQLMEMLDHPQDYTEQEIRDIINRDEDTRETYRQMVEARQSSRRKQAGQPTDVDAAWQKLGEKVRMESEGSATTHGGENTGAAANPSLFTVHSSLRKIAASFFGVLLVSGIAFAAVRIVQHINSQKPQTPPTEQATEANSQLSTLNSQRSETDTISAQPVIYDNIPLEKMLPEIASHYGAKVAFQSDTARQLRFYFVWKREQGIETVVENLNRFEHLHVTLRDDQITVE